MSVEIDVVMKKYFQNVLMTIVHDLNGGNETEMTAFVSKGSTFYHFRNKKHGACLISRLFFFFFIKNIKISFEMEKKYIRFNRCQNCFIVQHVWRRCIFL